MKEKFFHISLISFFYFIISNILFIQSIKSNSNALNNMGFNLTEECTKEIDLALDITILEKDKNYPWLIDAIGKGINDLGDEIECCNSLINTSFIIAKINKEAVFSMFNYNDTTLMRYLEIKSFVMGVCLMNACKEGIEEGMKNVFNNVTGFSGNNSESIIYVEYKESNNKSKYGLLIGFFIYILIKFGFGFMRLMIVPKGYEKYVTEILEQQETLENIDNADDEEKISMQQNQENQEIQENQENQENNNPIKIGFHLKSNFDYSSFLPIKFKIIKFFDLFNDFQLLITKKNKYYNDNGIETLIFMRSLVIYFLIYSATFIVLLSFPSRDIFTKYYFESLWILLFKLSINSLTSWIVLEAANTTYKLLNYIKTQIIDNNIRKKNLKTELLKIFGKFSIHFIPKIFIFFISYYSFYYKFEEFQYITKAKSTFSYIVENVIKINIKCAGNPFKIFNFNIFSRDYKDYDECYEFTYIYFNILICTLVFMTILYISILLRKQIFDIIIILINIILFFCSVLLIKDGKIDKDYEDPKTDEDKLYYRYYHLKGQNYSTKIFYSLIGFYNLGYILGFMFFYYENIKNSYISINRFSINDNNTNRKKSDNELSIKEHNKIEINENVNANTNINYFPLFFLNDFLLWLSNLKLLTKKIIIWISIVLMILLSMSFQIYLNAKEPDYVVELTTLAKIYFLYEKHIFIILFLIITIVSLTMPKRGIFKRLINSYFFISLSRIGFTIVCLYFSFIYILHSYILIKAQFHTQTIFLLSIGNFLLTYLFCIFFNIVFEIPIKKITKIMTRKKK